MKNRLNQLLNELVIDLCGHRYTHCYLHQRHNIVHPHLFGFGEFDCCFSLFLDWGGRTTTCIVITLPGTSPTGTRDSARVLLFSSILPTLMSFTSLTVFGAISLSCGHRARTNSLSAATVVLGSYLLGPMSVPSDSRNFTSIGSFTPGRTRRLLLGMFDQTYATRAQTTTTSTVPNKSRVLTNQYTQFMLLSYHTTHDQRTRETLGAGAEETQMEGVSCEQVTNFWQILQPAARRRSTGLLHTFPAARRGRGTSISVVGRPLPESHATVEHDRHEVAPMHPAFMG